MEPTRKQHIPAAFLLKTTDMARKSEGQAAHAEEEKGPVAALQCASVASEVPRFIVDRKLVSLHEW